MNEMMRPRPLTGEELRKRMRQYHAQIAPFVRHVAAIESLRPPPPIVLHPDGRFEVGERPPLPPEMQALSDQCRAIINTIRTSLFPDPPNNTADDSSSKLLDSRKSQQ